MSHYKVYVITKDGDIDAALAPFDENLEVDPHIDVRKEDVVPNFRNRYSRLLVQWKENAARAAAKGNEEEAGRAKAMVADISHDLDLSDEEIYQRETDGQDLDEDGNILSTYNPDSKTGTRKAAVSGTESGQKTDETPTSASYPMYFWFRDRTIRLCTKKKSGCSSSICPRVCRPYAKRAAGLYLHLRGLPHLKSKKKEESLFGFSSFLLRGVMRFSVRRQTASGRPW